MFFHHQLDLGFQQLMAIRSEEPSHAVQLHKPSTASHSSLTALALDTERMMSERKYSQLSVAPEWASQVSKNGKFQLTAKEWSLTSRKRLVSIPFGVLRMVHIKSQKNEIINSWIFPHQPNSNPVFAAEIISIGGMIRVAFIDIQIPGLEGRFHEEVAWLTSALQSRYATLPCDETPPEWAIEASQGNFAFARNADEHWLPKIMLAYGDYLENYLNSFVQTTSNLTGDSKTLLASRKALNEYKIHHMNSSPGKKFMENLFGVEWTTSFMNGFLFTSTKEKNDYFNHSK